MVTAEQFVRAWKQAFDEGYGHKRVAELTGMPHKHVAQRAAHLRRAGVRLVKFKGKLNVAALNAILESNGDDSATRQVG